jgi:hypothetical protein
MIGLSNRCRDVKHKFVEGTLLGAWLSSRSTLAATWKKRAWHPSTFQRFHIHCYV